ncbi:MAG: hypothetical protein JWP19_1614 [Rhodoglobus sp.]|nr:hypothetical protein [Rhodoglobus sp.]
MHSPRLLIGFVVLAALLAGCAEPGIPESALTPAPTVSTTPQRTVAPAPKVPEAAAVILSLQGLTVVDGAGATMRSALFIDQDGMLALVSGLMGSTPLPTDLRKGGLVYEWQGVSLNLNFGSSFLYAERPDLDGLALLTTEGIHVGSSRADLAALSPFDIGHDEDGDGTSDWFGVEQQAEPNAQSLAYPGQPGTKYILVRLEGDTITKISAPSGDFYDI